LLKLRQPSLQFNLALFERFFALLHCKFLLGQFLGDTREVGQGAVHFEQ